MYLLRKLALAFAGAAFFISLLVVTSYAQPGRAGWYGNNGRHRGWTQGRHRGWDNGRKRGWRNHSVFWGRDYRWRNRGYRYGRISPWEYRRLQRQRYRYYREDGYLGERDRRRPAGRYSQYRRY